MNTSIKYYVVLPLLILTGIVLTMLVGYKVYNLNSFKVYLISPDKSILVSSEFATTILIKGNKTPDVVEVYIDDKLSERKMFKDFNYTDLGNIKVAIIKIDPLYLSSGIHKFTVLLKGSMFLKDSQVSAEFTYEKMNNFSSRNTDENVKKVKEFFAVDLSQLVVVLNNAREYYINSDWRKSEKYTAQKKKVLSSDVDTVVIKKVDELIRLIENKSELDSIYNATNSLNLELFNKGYPFTNLMFDYRYESGNAKSLLMSYEISDSVFLEKENTRSLVHIIKRIDGLNVKEQFLGIKLPNSPFAFILDESLSLIVERYLRLFDKNELTVYKEVRRMTNGYVKKESDMKFVLEKVREETQRYVLNDSFRELVRKSNAYHEIRHLNDYKEGRKIGVSVPEVLNYFYGNLRNDNFFSLDSNFKVEKDICEILLKVNPEFSAYLYELVNSDGLRRLVLLNLFEKLVNPDKDDTSHQWAAKLIMYKLGEMNGLTGRNLIALPLDGNEEEWFGILKGLLGLPSENLERDAARLLMAEFG